MRLCYDYQIFAAQRHGGVSRYFVELAKRMRLVPGVDVRIVAPVYRNSLLAAEHNVLPVLGVYFPAEFSRAPGLCLGLSRTLSRGVSAIYRPDVVHETYYSRDKTLSGTARRVITVYDTITELFGDASPATQATISLRQSALSRADHIVCISANTRADLIRLYEVDPQKTSVIPLASSLGPPKDTPRPSDEPFFLYVGAREGYKNFLGLIAAFGESRLYTSHRLICFGGGKFTRMETGAMRKYGIPQVRISQVDGDDELLSRYYATAVALVYPSLYEGFGIPLLEAMECGCPVLCGDSGSLPEVGGDAALYFNAANTSAIAAAMLTIAQSPSERSQLVHRGKDRAKHFSWDICAQQTFAIYERLTSNQ